MFVIHGSATVPVFNRLADWRAAPMAPLTTGINRDGISGVTMPKLGPGDY
jgi:hypothetical protein